MMNVMSPDSVRIHNEMVHGGFTRYLAYAIPALIVFLFIWVKFIKD